MKNLIELLLFLWIVDGYSQHKITGYVIDAQNNTPLPYTKIITTKDTVYTTATGKFHSAISDTLLIENEGYYPQRIATAQQSKINIALQPNPNKLQTVSITAPNINAVLQEIPQRIHIITKQALNLGNKVEFAPILNNTPGIFMHAGALNTNRITIRGIGSRNPFGTVGIRTFYEDIPLTDGNGASAIEDLELAALSRIEIHKGPAASSYGAGLGGALVLLPEKTLFNTTKTAIQTTFGSFGLTRLGAKIAHAGTHSGFHINYSNTQSDGYRENNTYDRNTLTTTASILLGDRNRLHLIGNLVALKAFIPSAINQNDFDTNPEQAAFTWNAAKGFEDAQFGIIGISWNHEYKNGWDQKTSVYHSFRKNYEPRPFNILQENTRALGMRTRFTGNFFNQKKILKWNLGGEWYREHAALETYENLYLDFPQGVGSVQGNQIAAAKERRSYYNIFAQLHYALHSKWKITTGINANQTFFELDENSEAKGQFDFDTIISPTFGMVYAPTSTLRFFATIAHGFNTPTTEETIAPEGITQPNLQPETGWNFELGSDFRALDDKLQVQISTYLLEVKNLLVNRRTITDESFAINAGKTRHIGLELDTKYTWISTNTLRLQSTANATVNRFQFNEFITDEHDYSGNQLTGVPATVFNIGLQLQCFKGSSITLIHHYVSEIPANDSNTVFSESYALWNAKMGYKTTFFNTLKLHCFLGVQNIFDQQYASQLQVNANGFNGNSPRYFYPGNPINFYYGININYNF